MRKGLLIETAAAGLGFLILGYGAILLSRAGHSVAVVWPATAFGLIVILRHARGGRERAVMLAAIFAAGVVANLLGGSPPFLAIGYSLNNVVEILAGLLLAGTDRAPRFTGFAGVAKFGLKIGILPPMLGAACAMLITALGGQPDWLTSGRNWFFADLLGFCMLFPFGMSLSWRQIDKLDLPRRAPLALGLAALVVAASLLVFRQHMTALQFLVLPAALVATTRFRVIGAGAAILTIGLIALTSPGAATGPVAQIQLLQLFLAVIAVVCVRTAGLLNERDLHQAVIERRRRRAVRASRFKSQLLSHVSHEVRSPLSAIIGFSNMLESGLLSAERAPEFAAIIAHNGELLKRLHDDLLDLGRAEAGALAILSERVAVGATLETCISAIRFDATLGGKDVLIESVEDSLAITADPLRLAQILNNLIANAYKYGDNFSPIRVRARRLGDGFGRIEIVNAGPGIPAREREAVFRPFSRSEAVGRNVPGAGLGLSIAKMLVEAQGGRIDFESVPGRQTRFWIDLPLAA